MSRSATVSSDAEAEIIDRNKTFYVMQPSDGAFGRKVYAGSGLATARAAATTLGSYTPNVIVSSRVLEFDEALQRAEARTADYLLDIDILNWVDRATEWSGRRDGITLRLTIYEVQTGRPIATELSRASSKFFTLGGDHPEELVRYPVEAFLKKVIR